MSYRPLRLVYSHKRYLKLFLHIHNYRKYLGRNHLLLRLESDSSYCFLSTNSSFTFSGYFSFKILLENSRVKVCLSNSSNIDPQVPYFYHWEEHQ